MECAQVPLAWLNRVRGEYREMPDLSLTDDQAARLWGLDTNGCRSLLAALVATGFLRRTPRGVYVCADRG